MTRTLLDLFTLLGVLTVLFFNRKTLRSLLRAIEYQQQMILILERRMRQLEKGKEEARSANP